MFTVACERGAGSLISFLLPVYRLRYLSVVAQLGKVMAVDFPEGKLEKSSGLGNNVFYAKLPV
jgi:hypothetical protein|tara:strand:- start:199 stop:387 length:189 start_codon:yes stop_codon:yes gene_type:complete